ncbi:A24 family peptidase [Stenotrophomonas tumulicola]|uniref:Prepilin peptidase n=1 Tax=Stenotrophomonas tumulicola TaxID=1685415 RepID=A0A7W3FJZ1_9GAMM|nr:prepilin peptidase [Stenotrophomonas tumulicola]MBA8680835.1 prepilin peptidase [Stenotrophomonas tumulicola]
MTALGLLAMALSLRIVISDLYARRVPNTWLLAGAGVGAVLVAASALSSSFTDILPHLLGLLIGFAALIPFYAIRWMGAGDVKFFAVLGFLLGWQALLPVWIGASLLAGLHSVTVYVWRGVRGFLPMRAMSLQNQISDRLQQRPALQTMQAARQGRVGIPYAAYLGFAAIAWVLWSINGGSP